MSCAFFKLHCVYKYYCFVLSLSIPFVFVRQLFAEFA